MPEESQIRRTVRSRFSKALLSGLVVAGMVLAAGISSGLDAVALLVAGILGTLVTVITWLALEPNAPHDPDAGRQDRGHNYVRGEGGAGGM